MRHPAPCRYDDSLTGGGVDPATDFCSCKKPPARPALAACPACGAPCEVLPPYEEREEWTAECSRWRTMKMHDDHAISVEALTEDAVTVLWNALSRHTPEAYICADIAGCGCPCGRPKRAKPAPETLDPAEIARKIKAEFTDADAFILGYQSACVMRECGHPNACFDALRNVCTACETKPAPEEIPEMLSKVEVIDMALRAGFQIGTVWGQDTNKLMPASDGDTLMRFAELVREALRERD